VSSYIFLSFVASDLLLLPAYSTGYLA
jgi:hypothetical protein